MKNKSRIRIILIALLVIVISLSVGFGTWIISNYINTKPNNSENTVNKVITKYLDGTSTTFDGNIQLPIPKKFNNYLELDPKDVTYFYKLANSTEDYTECIENEKGPQNAGEYLIQVRYKFTDTDIFEVSGLKFTIHKRTIDDSNTTVVFDDVCTYNSKEQKPTFTVTIKFDSKTFILDETDFDTTYSNNTNATKNAKAEITSKNVNFAGTFTKTFTINQYDLSKNKDSVDVQLNNSYTYIGTRIDPSFTIKVTFSSNSAVEQLTSGKDYTTTGYTNASTNAPYVITGAGNYKGTLNGTFVINKANPSITTIPTFDAIYEGEFDSGFPTITNGKATLNGVEVKGTFIFNNVVNTYNIAGSDKNYYFDSKGTTTSAGFTNYISYTFIPEDQNNFNSVTKSDATILIKSVAFSGSTYYGSIEHALNAVTSGTINVIASIDEGRIIRTNCTIKSGVTLQFLYSGATTIIEDTTNYYPSETKNGNRTYALDNPATYRKNLIYIDESITLTNNGSIIIGGIISSGNGGGAPNCQTCDSYAEIILLDQSSIINNSGSKFINYGAVKDKTNANGEIIFNSGAFSQIPFIVIEHRGGNIFSKLYMPSILGGIGAKGSAFNRFYFQNILTTATYKSGSTMKGYVNLYASSKNNKTLIQVIGTSNSCLISLKNNAYLVSKYDNSSRINTINTYGDFDLNEMSMKIMNYTVSTSDVLFPVTWYFDITLNSLGSNQTNSITLKQNIKIMPGAKIRINSGVTVNAKKLIIYDVFNDVEVGCSDLYPTNKGEGMLIVNGILNITESVGGLILSENSGAKLNISSSANIYTDSFELTNKPSSPSWTQITKKLMLYKFENNQVSSEPSEGSNGVFYSNNGGWYSTTVTIKYDSCGGTAVDSKEKTIDGNGLLLTQEYLPESIRSFYTFAGWYSDSKYTNKVELGDVIYCSITLYAKWEPTNYNINYVDKYNDNSSSERSATSNNPTIFNIESRFTLNDAINEGYVFAGWFTDEECTNKISIVDGSNLISLLDENQNLNIYALWYPTGTKKYTINFNNSNPDVVCPLNETIVVTDSFDWNTYKLPQLTDNDNNPLIKLYFGGWYFNNELISQISESMFVGNENNTEYTLTLTSNWIDKNTLSLIIPGSDTIIGATMNFYYKPGTEFLIPNVEEKGVKFTQTSENGDVLINWLLDDGTICNTGDSLLLNDQKSITANIKKYIKLSIGSNQYTTATVTLDNNSGYLVEYNNGKAIASTFSGSTYSNGDTILITIDSVFSVKFTVANSSKNNSLQISNCTDLNGTTITSITTKNTDTKLKSKDSNTSIYITPIGEEDGGCVLPDTLITMADGTYKRAEDIVVGDIVMAFNHETGRFEQNVIIINEHSDQPATWHTILNLKFSDNTLTRICGEQGFFDVTLNKYVYITTSNYEDFIGHQFYGVKSSTDLSKKIVTLESCYLAEEFTKVYSPDSARHFNILADNMLQMPALLDGLFNIFEYDSETLQFDQAKMQEDIEKYGLLSYDDFKDILPYEVYLMIPAEYLNVSIGKGYITWDIFYSYVDLWLDKLYNKQ